MKREPVIEPCPDCGQDRVTHGGALASHVGGTHHKALVLCTERAVEGIAPVPRALADALVAAGVPVTIGGQYRRVGDSRRVELVPIEWAHADEIEEAGIPTAAARYVIAATRLVMAGMPWWRAWVQVTTTPQHVAHAMEHARTFGTMASRGYPWPGITTGASVSLAQGALAL